MKLLEMILQTIRVLLERDEMHDFLQIEGGKSSVEWILRFLIVDGAAEGRVSLYDFCDY